MAVGINQGRDNENKEEVWQTGVRIYRWEQLSDKDGDEEGSEDGLGSF